MAFDSDDTPGDFGSTCKSKNTNNHARTKKKKVSKVSASIFHFFRSTAGDEKTREQKIRWLHRSKVNGMYIKF